MDLTKTKKPAKEEIKPIGFKCTADGEHWAFFRKKTCRHCLPVFESSEKARLQGLAV